MNHSRNADEAIDKLGLTKQRQAVLRAVRESEDHLTANEVFNFARRILPGISPATVYNSLNYLKTNGLIGEIRFGMDASRYDPNLTVHDHAVCDNCGKLVDLELPLPKGIFKRAAEQSEFKIESAEITLRGLCPKCCGED